MPKKSINFQEQIQNSQKFLQKLQTIKKTSKQIKDKNKLTQHRNLWVKEYQYLSRLERDLDLELINVFDGFDKYFQYEIQEREIFKGNKYKNYSDMKIEIQENFDLFQAQTYQQVQSLPLLIEKCGKAKNSQINKPQIFQILNDIQKLLGNIQKENIILENQLIKQQEIQCNIQEQNIDDFEQLAYNFHNLRVLSSDIKGFDFEKQKIKKLKESEENLLEYLDCFNDKLSQDQIYEVINQFNHANKLLEETNFMEIEKINLDYEEPLKLNQQILQQSHNFNKINHIYQTYIGRGKSIQLYFERLTIQFPRINRKHLQLINNYIQAKLYKQKKLKAIKRNYYRQKQQLFSKVDKQIHIRIEKKIEKAQKRAQQLQRREERLKLQKQLQILRQQYKKRKEQKQKQRQIEQQLKKDEQRKKQGIRRIYLDELSKKAEQAHQIKSEKQLKQQQTELMRRQKQQQQKRKKLVENKPKVQVRQSIQRKKIQKKLQQKQIKGRQGQQQANRIKKAVEGYSFRPQVQGSEQRLNQPTEALVKRKQTKMDMADKVVLSKVNGFSVNQLMNDMRFKLNTALQEAGLSNTNYARELLVSMSKKNPS